MKIPNYDPGSSKSNYEQGHPCMPADVFRMLICGPSNSGKTNTLLHMLYELLEYDKIYLFSKNLHQNKYQNLLQEFAEKINPQVGYDVIEAYGDEIIPLEELPADNQKIVVFDDLVCKKKTKTASLIILSTGDIETAALFTSLKLSTRCRKTSVITAAIFVFSDFFQEKTNGLQTR